MPGYAAVVDTGSYNVAVVTNSIPSTGIPLPFISYGGTSAMIMMAEMGIVLGVSKREKRLNSL